MATTTGDSEEKRINILQNKLQILEETAERVKSEINAKVNSLIETINGQRELFLDKIDREVAKAKEPLKKYENEISAKVKAKKQLSEDLEGEDELIGKLTKAIDEELEKLIIELPNFQIQWNPSFTRLCEDIEKIGQLKEYTQSRFEKSVKTPLWTSSLHNGYTDYEVNEPKAIAIDPETSNIYVGDASVGKILILNKLGEYLGTLTLKKPSSIGRMVIYQDYIYCKSNSITPTTLYRLDKNAGELVNKFEFESNIDAFSAVSGEICLCKYWLRLNILPSDLSTRNEMNLTSPFFKKGKVFYSTVADIQCVDEELVTLIDQSEGHPIQVFDKTAKLLRAIAGDIPVIIRTEAYLCIDEHWNIILTTSDYNLVIVYSKEGRIIGSVGTEGQRKDEMYQPRGITLDKDGNLVVCNRRKLNILQAY